MLYDGVTKERFLSYRLRFGHMDFAFNLPHGLCIRAFLHWLPCIPYMYMIFRFPSWFKIVGS